MGFAVVASEVRVLAQRSCEAASEISVLINDSISKVDYGALLVNTVANSRKAVEDRALHLTQLTSQFKFANS